MCWDCRNTEINVSEHTQPQIGGLALRTSSPISLLPFHSREAANLGKEHLLLSKKTWEQVLAAPPPCCVTWGELLTFSES